MSMRMREVYAAAAEESTFPPAVSEAGGSVALDPPADAGQDMVRRSVPVEVRAVNEDKLEADFVAATETPVDVGFGREVLRMSGLTISQFRRNPVILDSHRRFSISSVLGKGVSVEKDRRQLRIRVRFRDNDMGRDAFEAVKGDFVRAMSIGFVPQVMREIAENESDGEEGDGMVSGPATIITKALLLEASLVPIPADPNALKRIRCRAESGKREGNMAEKTPENTQKQQPEDIEQRAQGESGGGEQPAAEPERASEDSTARVAEQERELDAMREAVHKRAPKDLDEAEVEEVILEHPEATLREILRKLHELRRSRVSGPVGTPEPPHPEGNQERDHQAREPETADFVRSVVGG